MLHFIFLVANAMGKFDPLADLLVSEDEFLTWRRGDQRLPNSQDTLVDFIVIDRGSDGRWFLAPCGSDVTVYPGVHAWLDRTAADAEQGRLGLYRISQYHGIVGVDDEHPDIATAPKVIETRVGLMNKVASELGMSARFDTTHPLGWWQIRHDFLRALYQHTAAL